MSYPGRKYRYRGDRDEKGQSGEDEGHDTDHRDQHDYGSRRGDGHAGVFREPAELVHGDLTS